MFYIFSSQSPLEDMEAHIIADRSAEQGASESKDAGPAEAVALPAVGSAGHAASRPHTHGEGRARRGRRCWCRRKRRSGRRRSSLMGNMVCLYIVVNLFSLAKHFYKLKIYLYFYYEL